MTGNERGPKCAHCGFRPDDPVWVIPAGQSREISCFGCIADRRATGHAIKIIARVIYIEELDK